jgi:ribose 5-phosphate isomerase B
MIRVGIASDHAHQGVEDEAMNVICLGGEVLGTVLAAELIETFLAARCSGAVRHRRRLAEVRALEHQEH